MPYSENTLSPVVFSINILSSLVQTSEVTITTLRLGQIFDKLIEDPSIYFNVDLITQKFYSTDGIFEEKFEINNYNKTCLLNGFDNIDYLLSIKEKIVKYEEKK